MDIFGHMISPFFFFLSSSLIWTPSVSGWLWAGTAPPPTHPASSTVSVTQTPSFEENVAVNVHLSSHCQGNFGRSCALIFRIGQTILYLCLLSRSEFVLFCPRCTWTCCNRSLIRTFKSLPFPRCARPNTGYPCIQSAIFEEKSVQCHGKDPYTESSHILGGLRT